MSGQTLIRGGGSTEQKQAGEGERCYFRSLMLEFKNPSFKTDVFIFSFTKKMNSALFVSLPGS